MDGNGCTGQEESEITITIKIRIKMVRRGKEDKWGKLDKRGTMLRRVKGEEL